MDTQKSRSNGIRPNYWSDGRSLEHAVETVASIYEQKGVLRLKKVTPPARTYKDAGGQSRVVFLENPFVDMVGCWTERGGRALLIECKITAEPVLVLAGGKDGKSGLSKHQIENLLIWEKAGAAVGVLWQWHGAYAWITTTLIKAFYPKEKHVHFRDMQPVAQGEGFILIDFAQNLRTNYSV